ncbi:MAG TPA: hypothetical protein VI968_04155 [archaeon]|nr:hypothetical protein [archaeon]
MVTLQGKGLVQMSVPLNRAGSYGRGSGESFYDPSVRNRFRPGFDASCHYTFLQTVATDGFMSAVRDLRKERAQEVNLEASVVREYIEALYFLAGSKFPGFHCDDVGFKRGFISYPLVGVKGSHPELPKWPVVHVVKDSDKQKFPNAIKFGEYLDDLNGDKAYKFLKKRQAPQNYHKKLVDAVHDGHINPFVMQHRVWIVDGETLRNALDFLGQFSFTDSYSAALEFHECSDVD